jgi:hypothetical protein
VAVGAPGRGREWGGAAEHRERRLRAQSLRVVPGGDQQLSRDVGADPEQSEQRGVDRGDQRADQDVELGDLGGELLVALSEGAAR